MVESATEPSGSQASRNTLYGIQVLRGLAALLVVFRHTAKIIHNDAGDSFEIGQFGVDIFFVISGVVIYLSGRNLDAGDFMKRRLIRIIPLYWPVLILAALGDMARHKNNALVVKNTLYSLLFIPSSGQNGEIFPPITVGWSLNFEMYFYVMCALVIIVAGRRRLLPGVTLLILAAVAIGLGLRRIVDVQQFPPLVLLLPITLEFLVGMWLAHAYRTRGFKTGPRLCLALAALSLVWLILAPTATPYTEWRPLRWGIPAILIVWVALCAETQIAFSRWKPALLLGDASYALYLVHPIVLGLLWAIAGKIGIAQPGWLAFSLLVIASTIAGLFVHWFIERPIMSLCRRSFPPKRALVS